MELGTTLFVVFYSPLKTTKWPPQSPDLNPTENVWKKLNERYSLLSEVGAGCAGGMEEAEC